MSSRIRGVCPRGLIEAASQLRLSLRRLQRIRGVCPRGLIEASVIACAFVIMSCIRGVCPRGLIEA